MRKLCILRVYPLPVRTAGYPANLCTGLGMLGVAVASVDPFCPSSCCGRSTVLLRAADGGEHLSEAHCSELQRTVDATMSGAYERGVDPADELALVRIPAPSRSRPGLAASAR